MISAYLVVEGLSFWSIGQDQTVEAINLLIFIY